MRVTRLEHIRQNVKMVMMTFFRINDIPHVCQWKNPDGVNRKSIIDVLKEGSDVRSCSSFRTCWSTKNGTLKEIFGAGNAAVVNPIIGFSSIKMYITNTKTKNSAVQWEINEYTAQTWPRHICWTVKVEGFQYCLIYWYTYIIPN
jgi:branched-chain amino acid aminotransferase